MLSRKKSKWTTDSSKSEQLIDKSNVGRILLEKMGWEDGQGLGKDNQGMIENPLWKGSKRGQDSKRGFKCKDEHSIEVLPHQNAFEDLLGELNAQAGETSVNTDDSIQRKAREGVKSSKKPVRYKKMARAKDISNYSAKDFEGIVGKEITKKNLDFLGENSNKIAASSRESYEKMYVTGKVGTSVIAERTIMETLTSYSDGSDESDDSLEPSIMEYCSPQETSTGYNKVARAKANYSSKHKITNDVVLSHVTNTNTEKFGGGVCKVQTIVVEEKSVVECITYYSEESDENGRLAENRKRKKKRKQLPKSSLCSVLPNKLENCSAQNIASTSAECTGIESEEPEGSEEIYALNTERNYIKEEDSTSHYETNLDEKLNYPDKFMCNFISISKTHQNDSAENRDVSRNDVTLCDSSDRTNNKSSNLERAETKRVGNKMSNDSTTLNDADKNGENNSLKFLLPTNNFFLTGKERLQIRQYINENLHLIQEVANNFVGSNLMTIKGYGNW